MPGAEVIERERRLVTVPNREPNHKRGCRGRRTDAGSNVPPRVLRCGSHRDLTGGGRLDTGQGPDSDTSPVELVELTPAVGTIDEVASNAPMLHRDKLSVEIGGEAIAEVPVRKQIRGYLEFRQQAKRTPDPLEGAEFEDHLFVAVEQAADYSNFIGRQLSVQIGREQLSARVPIGN
jgi:hypothetical protein